MYQEEPHIHQGRIEVICGSMFSGKTEELIRRLKRARIARQKVEIYKPSIDTRYSDEDVVSHDSNSIASTPVDSARSILLLASEAQVVGIDEAQFFDASLVDVCNELARHAICVRCGGLAYVSHRKVADEQIVLLGEQTEYEPLCRCCYEKTQETKPSPCSCGGECEEEGGKSLKI
mgnify:CR=1 FL=1